MFGKAAKMQFLILKTVSFVLFDPDEVIAMEQTNERTFQIIYEVVTVMLKAMRYRELQQTIY